MSTFFENTDRKVIPNFRELKKTILFGELNPIKLSNKPFEKHNLVEYPKDFTNNKSVGTAGDLLSAAMVNISFDSPIVIEAAIYGRINKIKQDKYFFYENPFLHVELSRLYSTIGQKDSALASIRIARSLSPHNRYVLRSFSRLMAHFSELDTAHENLKRNPATKFDPWLLASEIAFASLRNKTSNFMKVGREAIFSKNFSPFSTSELASSIGTVELKNGDRKKSKLLLQSALNCPNDNSLAQIEWINNKEGFFDLHVASIEIENKYEALTLDSFNSKKWKELIQNAEKWFIDMPFAKRPVTFAHHAASIFLEDYDTGIKFCKAGLIANPSDPTIINNIAFSYAMNGDPDMAFHYLNKINLSTIKEDNSKICLFATTGLTNYRKGNVELGKEFYFKAIKGASEIKSEYYSKMAILNLVREELRIKSITAHDLYAQAINIDVSGDFALIFMKNKLKEVFQKQEMGHS